VYSNKPLQCPSSCSALPQVLKYAEPLRPNAGEFIAECINTARLRLCRPFDVRWCSHGLVVTTHNAHAEVPIRHYGAAVRLFDAGRPPPPQPHVRSAPAPQRHCLRPSTKLNKNFSSEPCWSVVEQLLHHLSNIDQKLSISDIG